MDSYELRSLIGSTLDLIKGKPVKVIKAYINVFVDMLKEENYDRSAKEIVDYINSLYGQDSKSKLIKVLRDIDNYGKPTSEKNRNSLVRIIRKGIRSIIFDHYTQLNPKTRKELKEKIEAYMKKNKRTSSKIAIPNTRANKTLLYGMYKKEAVKPSERKLERIEIKQSDLKNNLVDREVQDKKERIQQTRKEKKTQSKFPEIIMPTIKQEEKELIARSEAEADEDGSSTSETLESNSIQLSLERQKEFNTMRYVTLYPEAFTPLAPKYQKHFKIVHRSVKATTPDNLKVLTIWVEESTGIIPQYILNKYTTTTPKPRKHKNKKAHKIHEKKQKKEQTKPKGQHHKKYKRMTEGIKQKHGHKSYKHDTTRHAKKHDSKHRTTYKPKPKYEKEKYTNNKEVQSLFEENEILSTNKVMNMFGLVRLDVNQNLLLNNVTAKLPRAPYRGPSILRTPSSKHRKNIPQLKTSLSSDLPSNKPRIGLLLPASSAAIQKRYKMLSDPQNWNERKNSKHNTRSDEGFIEKRDQNNENMLRIKDPALIQRLHQLQKELKEVKNKINTVAKNTKKQVAARRSKGKGVAETADKPKVKDTESEDIINNIQLTKIAEVITTPNLIRDKQQELISTVKKPEYQIEYKVVKEKGSKFKEIVPDYTTKENEVRGLKPLQYGAIKLQSNDERQEELHNKSILINSSTKSSLSTTTTKYITTVKTVEVNTRKAKPFTAKALRVATSTIQPKTAKRDVHTNTKPIAVTVASTTSFTTANTNETTTSDAIVYAFKNNVEDLPASATPSPTTTTTKYTTTVKVTEVDALTEKVVTAKRARDITSTIQPTTPERHVHTNTTPISTTVASSINFANVNTNKTLTSNAVMKVLGNILKELATPANAQCSSRLNTEVPTFRRSDIDFPNYDVTEVFWGGQPGLNGTIHEDATSTFLPTLEENIVPVITFAPTPEEMEKIEPTPEEIWPFLKQTPITLGFTWHTNYPGYPYEPPPLDDPQIYITQDRFPSTPVFNFPDGPGQTTSFIPETEGYEILNTTSKNDSLTNTTSVTELPGSAVNVSHGDDENTTTTMSPAKQRYYEMMETRNEGYLPIFLAELLRITIEKDENPVKELLREVKPHVFAWYETDRPMWLGEPLAKVIVELSRFISESEVDYVRSSSAMMYQMLKDRKTDVAEDVNSIIEDADRMYTEDEGEQLFDALVEYEQYPNGT
ncbi:unnamed protein product [Spodoptera exigua]|nr:unnamed protein product [Spodoptera exigua]